jgi:molecular chaperone DnaK
MGRQGELREIRSTRFDPRADPEGRAPPPKHELQRPPAGPALPAAKPGHAVRERAPEDDALMTLPGRTARLHWNEDVLPRVPAVSETPRASALGSEAGVRIDTGAQSPSGKGPAPSAQAPEAVELPSAELTPEEIGVSEALLIDVTPHSLRVETVGGYSDVLIAANSRVPCDRTRIFSTASDGQTQVFIRVAQGESRTFAENMFLGELELAGIDPLARGDAQLAVTFEIDADGILAVRAKDKRTGKETAARMHVFGAQTEERDLQKMLQRQRQRAVV